MVIGSLAHQIADTIVRLLQRSSVEHVYPIALHLSPFVDECTEAKVRTLMQHLALHQESGLRLRVPGGEEEEICVGSSLYCHLGEHVDSGEGAVLSSGVRMKPISVESEAKIPRINKLQREFQEFSKGSYLKVIEFFSNTFQVPQKEMIYRPLTEGDAIPLEEIYTDFKELSLKTAKFFLFLGKVGGSGHLLTGRFGEGAFLKDPAFGEIYPSREVDIVRLIANHVLGLHSDYRHGVYIVI